MWFFTIKDKRWHNTPGPIGKEAICGTRWGATTVDTTLGKPDYGEECEKCRKILDTNEKAENWSEPTKEKS